VQKKLVRTSLNLGLCELSLLALICGAIESTEHPTAQQSGFKSARETCNHFVGFQRVHFVSGREIISALSFKVVSGHKTRSVGLGGDILPLRFCQMPGNSCVQCVKH
jgi:hypothetical protein